MASTTTTFQNAANLKAAVLSNERGELDAWLEVNDEAEVREAIRMLLRTQDRDTRHACAEAIANLPYEEGTLISSRDAQAACINVQAV